ncbi:MAG: alpha/beta hydrolase, partial [Spirochaetaceae bacterium]
MVSGYSSIAATGVPYAVIGDGLPTRLVIPGVEPEVEVPDGLRLQGVRGAFEELVDGGLCVAWRRTVTQESTLDRIVDDYVDLIHELELADLSLIGVSTGSIIAVEVAARIGRRCRRLALVAGGARVSDAGRSLLDLAIEDASAGRWRELARRQTRAYYPGPIERAVLGAIAWGFPQLYGTPAHSGHYVELTRIVRDADVRERVAHVAAPILIVNGEHDVFFPPDEARQTALIADYGT